MQWFKAHIGHQKQRAKNKAFQTRLWFERNERFLSPLFFASGLILDRLTLTSVDLLYDNVVLLTYLTIAIVSVILINFGQAKQIQTKFFQYLPLATQFAFGGLFSGYIIYYTKSASWTVSWIFLLIIIGIFIANERFRNNYKKIDFQINILFVAVFSFLIFFIPVISRKIGVNIFIISGLVSLFIIFLLISFLSRFIAKIKKKRKNKMTRNIIVIYVIFNILYFTNIIPPIPLSMKDIGVYHNIQRVSAEEYIVEEEYFDWYRLDQRIGNSITKVEGKSIYVFSSVFAPTRIDTTIIHVWQKFNEDRRRWEIVDRIQYPIQGGRVDGYRGYSFLNNTTAGLWRVDVTTQRGQVIGRIRFEILDEGIPKIREKII